MKLFATVLCLLMSVGIATSVHAQKEYGVEVGYLKPTGKFGQRFGASPSLRLTRTFGDSDRFYQRRVYMGVEYYSAQSDTVEIGYYVGQNPYTNQFDNDVFIGTREINRLAAYAIIGAQGLFRPWRKSPFRPYGIIDLHAKIGVIDREVQSAQLNDAVSGGDVGIMLGGGGGVEYLTKGKITVYANVTRNYNYTNEQGDFVYWDTALGVTYIF